MRFLLLLDKTNLLIKWFRIASLRQKLVAFQLAIRRGIAFLQPIGVALILFILLTISLLWLLPYYDFFTTVGQGIYIEIWGSLVDIFIVGTIFAFFANRQSTKEKLARYLEEIEDFKKWDSEESRLRMGAAIRRLVRLGKTDIDFSGIVLKNFSFRANDIDVLAGATFSSGIRLDRLSKNSTVLEEVDFSFVDCRNVIFSKAFSEGSALGMVGKNLTFIEANLTNSCFDGARMMWDDYIADPKTWYEQVDAEAATTGSIQTHYPSFSGANLLGCTFRYADLSFADFRNAENVLRADFSGATGLETCFFDENVRELVLSHGLTK